MNSHYMMKQSTPQFTAINREMPLKKSCKTLKIIKYENKMNFF